MGWSDGYKKTGEEHSISRKAYDQLQEYAHCLEEMLSILKTCGCAPHDLLPEKLKILEKLYIAGEYSA